MVYRTVICVLLTLIPLIVGCGLFDGGQKSETRAPSQVPSAVAPPAPPPGATWVPSPPRGATSLEERIANANVIGRMRLISVTPTVNAVRYVEQWFGPGYRTNQTAYATTLEFRFQVLEYLKGMGQNEVVAVAMDLEHYYATEAEARSVLPALAAARDTRWDERDAIIFLRDSDDSLPSTSQEGRYFLALLTLGGIYDAYTIASRYTKLWLPAEAAGGASSQSGVGERQRFLMDAPSAGGEAPTIALGDLKTRIAAVTTKLNAGDGSAEYRECVLKTYELERKKAYRIANEPSRANDSIIGNVPESERNLSSGLPAGSAIYEDTGFGYLPDKREQLWLDGGDAGLFNVKLGDSAPTDWTEDGVIDGIRFAKSVASKRPLVRGEYNFFFNNRGAFWLRCNGYVIRYEWTVNVAAPDGVLHELFFDPVTVGSAVKADGTNGVLKPTSFTDANGTSTTIQRIEWQSGTVKVGVTPDDALDGQTVDIIELDGTVSLSLDVADATVDSANDTLNWSVSSQPWEDGDKLMVRIREVSP